MPQIQVDDSTSSRLVAAARRITCTGAPHGITDTHEEQLSHDLLESLETV